jgi:hypothetical protein
LVYNAMEEGHRRSAAPAATLRPIAVPTDVAIMTSDKRIEAETAGIRAAIRHRHDGIASPRPAGAGIG